MARINTNIGAITAQRHLARSNQQMNETIQRLASGLRITRGADDPAGLIASERLRSEIKSVNQAITNTNRASNIIATSEGALDEVANLLTDIQDLIVEAANKGALSEDEVKANQLQIDSSIKSITRIADSTTFAGHHLLNGSLDYLASGVDNNKVKALDIQSAQFGSRSYIPVNIEVTTSAQTARLAYVGTAIGKAVSLEVQGNLGTTVLSFPQSATTSSIVEAINAVSDATGVIATYSTPPSFRIDSMHLGSRQFVGIRTLPGSGALDMKDRDGATRTRVLGRDAIAQINGAMTFGNGNELTLKTSTLDMVVLLDSSIGLGSTSFAITGGGALFQVGPQVNTNLQVNLGIQSIAATRLGNANLGFLSQIQSGGAYSLLGGEFQQAQQIVTEAIRQVSVLRGRLGAFEKDTLDANVSQLSITLENLMSSESAIRDADFATETSELTRTQILVNAGTSVLALAQQSTQSVLKLLG